VIQSRRKGCVAANGLVKNGFRSDPEAFRDHRLSRGEGETR